MASRGASGGILLMWDRRVVRKIEFVWESMLLRVHSRMWMMTSHGLLRGFMVLTWIMLDTSYWEELAGLISRSDLPWCIGGDFYVTLFPSESGGGRRRSAMTNFLDFIL